jgi:LacI family transcriptional regulator
MIRLILLTDFTEAFPHNMLRGILRFAREQSHEPWVACRMPPSFKDKYGLDGVLEWAKNWGANAIIGRFDNDEDVTAFRKNGIVALAQDFKQRFTVIPNITSDYFKTGDMAANFFLDKGFKNFAFYGYQNTVWSDERCDGFFKCISQAGYGEHFLSYKNQQLDTLWFYDSSALVDWLKSLPPHTALFCCDDNQGNKITEVCNFSGIRIPDDVAVLGVDNDVTVCNLSAPTLSSVNLDIERGGYDAAALIVQMMAHPDTPLTDVVIQPTTIVSRSSTNIYATDDPYILKALEYIHGNLYSPINVTDVLRQLPLSRRLLEIRFRKVIGQSIYNYISECRMKLFARLLQEGDTPVCEIALNLGMNNYGNLARHFKSVMGCTPTEYRKKHRQRQ